MAALTLSMLCRLVLQCQNCEDNSRLQKRLVGIMDAVNTTSIHEAALPICVKAVKATHTAITTWE